LFRKTPRNLLIGNTALAMLEVNAYIVASTCAGVSFAKSTPGGNIRKANIRVPIAVEEQMTHKISGIPNTKFHLKTKHISKKLASIVKHIAPPIIMRGSVSLKNF
jgi:hypothetical protein